MYSPPLYETSRAQMVSPSTKAKPALNVAQQQEPGACDIVLEVKPGVNKWSIASAMFPGTGAQHIIHRYLNRPIDRKDQKFCATLIFGAEKVEPILHSCDNDVINKKSEQPSSAYGTKPLPTTLMDPEELFGHSNL
jgi:hypothetical protein